MSIIRTLALVGCLSLSGPLTAVAAGVQPHGPAPQSAVDANYRIAPGDELQIFVWKNPDLSVQVPVRPDGKVTTPLAPDVQAQGKTTTQLASDMQAILSQYIQAPVVTVIVKNFATPSNSAAIRVIGAAGAPKSVPYRAGITALDVLVEVGGLDVYASGNSSQLIRRVDGRYETHRLRLADLLKRGKLNANVELMPGDIIRIPQRAF